MGLKKIQIKNFKSLVNFELDNLKKFNAFVGPNASGKSNIFEAIEFANYVIKYQFEASTFFGGKKNIYSFDPKPIDKLGSLFNQQSFLFEFYDNLKVEFDLDFGLTESNNNRINKIGYKDGESDFEGNIISYQMSPFDIRDLEKRKKYLLERKANGLFYDNDYENFIDNFSRIFIGKSNLVKSPGAVSDTNTFLNEDASNLAQILGKILEDNNIREDFFEWVKLLIPEFSHIESKISNIDGSYDFTIFEKNSKKPFPRNLLSDGTHNILSLMTAVYQSKEPQFLLIEEPENGLHPYAIQFLVDFFKEKCETEGHTIWLNTHSQSLVKCLKVDEIILINKIDGQTKAKQLTSEDNLNINTDEAWLTNTLGGGILWSK